MIPEQSMILDLFGQQPRVTAPAEVLELLTALYGEARGAAHGSEIMVQTGTDGGYRVVFADEERLVPPSRLAVCHVENRVTNYLIRHARGRHVFHGAALCHGGRAGLLLGPAGSGKSTLALAVLRRGCRLLSEEFADLLGPSGHVVRCARRPALAEDSPLHAEFGAAGTLHTLGGDVKALVWVPEEMWEPASVPLRTVILLDGGAPPAPPGRVVVVLDRAGEHFAREARARGARSVCTGRDETGGEVVTLDRPASDHLSLAEIVDSAARGAGALVLRVVAGEERVPDFDQEPRLEELATDDAFLGALPHLLTRPPDESAPLREALGPLWARFARCQAYRLTVGHLEETLCLLHKVLTAHA